jgi:tRNA (guanine-N7-)-methyltransferase
VQLNGFTVLADTDDLYASTEAPEYNEARALRTHYENQWLERGMTIKYLCWQLPQRERYEEPDIEIEKDNYRSYGRYSRTNDSYSETKND